MSEVSVFGKVFRMLMAVVLVATLQVPLSSVAYADEAADEGQEGSASALAAAQIEAQEGGLSAESVTEFV